MDLQPRRDQDVSSRSLGSDILQFREWGTDQTHPLSAHPPRLLVGTDGACGVCLTASQVFPLHAQLSRERAQWMVRALGDTPVLRKDGAPCRAFALEPGVEVGIGAVILIAESERWMALRRFCARLLGWTPAHRQAVDSALHSLRRSLTHEAPLVLRGDGDLVPVAQALHRHTLGADLPFVVCDIRRRSTDETVRSPTNYESLDDAVAAAAGGTLCVRSTRLPRGFSKVLQQLRHAALGAQLVICVSGLDPHAYGAAPIVVPSPRARTLELPRLLEELEQEAQEVLQEATQGLSPEDRAWLLLHATTSLPELEKAALRLLALRTSSSFAAAAARLGMAPISLRRWLHRRGLRAPTASLRHGNTE